MTFDLPAGIQRRTMVMSFWTCSGMMALGYPDVVCLYYGSSAVVWFFVVIFLGASYYCLFGVIIGLVTRIPSPFSHVITISGITMFYTAVLLAQLVHVPQLNEMLRHYRSAPFKLGLNISGVMRPSGAYDIANAKSALTFIFPTSGWIMFGSILLSILVSTYFQYRENGTFLLNLNWTRTNGFLSHYGKPNWITALPLSEKKLIKIGNKLYCKPSTQATLGIATIVPRNRQFNSTEGHVSDGYDDICVCLRSSSHHPVHAYLVSMAMSSKCVWYVKKNQFAPTIGSSRLDQVAFKSHRGTCTN